MVNAIAAPRRNSVVAIKRAGLGVDAPRIFSDDDCSCYDCRLPWRCIPLGHKAWLFCGSDRGGQRAAVIYTLIPTTKLNDVDLQAWLADVLARIADHSATRLDELLP